MTNSQSRTVGGGYDRRREFYPYCVQFCAIEMISHHLYVSYVIARREQQPDMFDQIVTRCVSPLLESWNQA